MWNEYSELTGYSNMNDAASRSRTARLHQRFTVAKGLAFVGAFLAVSFLVVGSSQAAFTSQTSNTGNQVSVPAVQFDLTDNDAAVAMFDNLTMLPNETDESCIEVTYTGDLDPADVGLFIAGPPTGNLAQYLTLTIDMGTDAAPSFGDCSGFVYATTLYGGTLSSFASSHHSLPARLSTWDPSNPGDPTRLFRFTIGVQNEPLAQNETAGFGFTWETTS